MSASIPEQFTGYAAMNEEKGKKLEVEKWSFTPKKWAEDDVDIKIHCTSICGSCIHTINNGWPSPTSYPCVAGHECVGTVVRAGSKSGLKEGQRVGVGAQAGSCGECDLCKENREQYCEKGMIGTYQGKWEDGSIAQGGYADYMRCKGRFAIPVPEGISDEEAAPLFCAGITTASPLLRFGAGPGKRVGIVGIGGLGHLGLQISKALGADTYALSHSDRKVPDAEKLGVAADHFVVYKDIAETAKKWARKFDIIVCTANNNDLPIESLFFKLLRPEGALVLCGLPEEKLPAMYGHALVGKGVTLAGSLIGGTAEIKQLLELAVEHNIRPWIETRPMSQATQTLQDMHAGKARYRYVLSNKLE
ncbi:hypothetical protein JCM3765_006291 [Sporobolomyces pararoseus]